MGEPWRDEPSWQVVLDASAATGRNIEHLLLEADAEELRQTRNAQLATFVLSMVTLDACKRAGVFASTVAGHSLGEYSALTAAGAIGFQDAVRLVAERGEAMQAAASEREGTMAAVLGLGDDDVAQACEAIDGEVWVANVNAPGQVVIAGVVDAVAAASAKAKELGAKRVLPVKVSGAFHTPLMAPAGDRLANALAEAEMLDTSIGVYANVDAKPHHHGAEWGELLKRQLVAPVLWRQSLEAMSNQGINAFYELGPGAVLTATAKRTVPHATFQALNTPADIATMAANSDSTNEDSDDQTPSGLARAS